MMRSTVENAWPNRLEGPAFNAAGNDVALQPLELCHEGLHLEMWRGSISFSPRNRAAMRTCETPVGRCL